MADCLEASKTVIYFGVDIGSVHRPDSVYLRSYQLCPDPVTTRLIVVKEKVKLTTLFPFIVPFPKGYVLHSITFYSNSDTSLIVKLLSHSLTPDIP